jgi:hypothetical protein
MTIDKQQFHFEWQMLDSGCMMLDDQGMTEEWIVRVQGKEYGPVDIDTLLEWKREGRLLPENEARPANADLTAVAGSAKEVLWSTAAAIPGLFDAAALAAASAWPTPPPLRTQHRSFGQILAETFQIYRKGFFQFFCFSLLPAVPSFFLQLALPSLDLGSVGAANWEAVRPNPFSLSLLLFLVLLWPVFLAGIQVTSADMLGGQKPRLGILFRRSLSLWPRMAGLSLLVYGSYFVWSVVPLVAAFGLLLGEASVLALLLAALLLTFQVYMTARLWINFMFWQQSATLGGVSGFAALRESKTLARSGRDLPWYERPLWRGAFIVSIWIIVAFIVSTAVQLPFLLVRLRGITSFEQMQTLLQNLSASRTPEPLLLAASITTALVHAAIRPLLGIAFVVLYLDSKIPSSDSA